MPKKTNSFHDWILIAVLTSMFTFYKALAKSFVVWVVLELINSGAYSVPYLILFAIMFVLDFICTYSKVKRIYHE